MQSNDSKGAGVQVLDGRGIDTAVTAALIALAFLELAPCEFLVPDPGERLAVMARFFGLEVDAAKEHGRVLVTADRTGVALWVPRSGERPEVPEMTDELAEATGKYAENFLEFERELVTHYPAEARAFWHLTELAVHPEAQGSGLGTALLGAMHAELDDSGAPAYLEAASLPLQGFYERCAYGRLGSPIVLPNGATMFPMGREPQRR